MNGLIEEVFCKKKKKKREFLIEWLPWIPQNQYKTEVDLKSLKTVLLQLYENVFSGTAKSDYNILINQFLIFFIFLLQLNFIKQST